MLLLALPKVTSLLIMEIGIILKTTGSEFFNYYRLLEAINLSRNVFIRAAQNILQNNAGKNQLVDVVFDVDDTMKIYDEPIPQSFVDMISSGERCYECYFLMIIMAEV